MSNFVMKKGIIFIMDKPSISEDKIELIHDNKYLKTYGMYYNENYPYLQASRRAKEDLTVLKSDEEYKNMLPDAATMVVVVETPNDEPRLFLQKEFRYPVGRFLVSPPAGLIDAKDKEAENPILSAAKREIKEETGMDVKDTDELRVLGPVFFASPGMTDESNAMVFARIKLDDLSSLSNDGAEGGECFDGYRLLTKAEAMEYIRNGKDENGSFFSIFTWASLLYFALEC